MKFAARSARVVSAIAVAALAGSGLAGCATVSRTPADLGEADTRALTELTVTAVRDADLLEDAADVECWLPTAHLFERSMFRVLCRVHYEEAGSPRYRDMICVGDIEAEPVSKYCDRWTFYTGTPEFADHPGYFAP